MYVYQRILNSYGMILHGLHPPMPTYPGVQAVLGRNDAQFHITGWHVAGAVDQIYDALEEHPPEKPMEFPMRSGKVLKQKRLETNPGGIWWDIWYIWLVVYLPLWKIWKSVGTIIPNIYIYMEK